MKTKELKNLIRSMVRECVHEMLAEKYIERSLQEIAGVKHQPVMAEQAGAVPAKPKKQVPKLSRQEMAERYGLTEDSPMVNLFEDTMNTNPVLNGEDKDPPGTISETVMEKSGIMAKDWSKYF